MFRTIKAIVLWGFARNTWQYDVLCVLILCFIFLTPKHWFENNKPMTHRQVTVAVEPGRPELAQPDIEFRVRAIPENGNAEVLGYRPVRDPEGKIVAYEVDIR
jgi:hypothetical protein